jgi:hypothetical protein
MYAAKGSGVIEASSFVIRLGYYGTYRTTGPPRKHVVLPDNINT